MKVYINNQLEALPKEPMTVAELIAWKKLPMAGTAVAVNDRLVVAKNWEVKQLAEEDRITLITAAFGG
ncbi:MAG: sulfur carrier protein ThiS [Clostridium sp.]|nr:sulfur carrier protein ThiS [Prevotella sp.]MCM1429315.1 sulfur carrier protein ThiS [Clostridium sp.]MCM1475652.1 sulfur carrier protein ThiS [Muribaculaceae bacterium]